MGGSGLRPGGPPPSRAGGSITVPCPVDGPAARGAGLSGAEGPESPVVADVGSEGEGGGLGRSQPSLFQGHPGVLPEGTTDLQVGTMRGGGVSWWEGALPSPWPWTHPEASLSAPQGRQGQDWARPQSGGPGLPRAPRRRFQTAVRDPLLSRPLGAVACVKGTPPGRPGPRARASSGTRTGAEPTRALPDQLCNDLESSAPAPRPPQRGPSSPSPRDRRPRPPKAGLWEKQARGGAPVLG